MNMKELTIKRLDASFPLTAQEIPALLDKEQVEFQMVDSVNWKDAYPYCPEAKFRLATIGEGILLDFRVTEASVRAVAGHDNGPVWEDACVEFFSIPAGDGIYYNMECNCAGTLLIGAGAGRANRQRATQDVLDQVLRWSSLGRESFEERLGACSWEVALMIPWSAFFLHHIQSLQGQTIRANFYKCGDKLQTPHFLSWNPIDLPKPDFHCPAFFGTLHFE